MKIVGSNPTIQDKVVDDKDKLLDKVLTESSVDNSPEIVIDTLIRNPTKAKEISANAEPNLLENDLGKPKPISFGNVSGNLSSESLAAEKGSNNETKVADILVSTFNNIRDELISTILYLVGNREDAQDIAQETFLKCWRIGEQLSEIQNIRAWIFRVALNTAKDLQRSAWRRRSRNYQGEEMMIASRESSPMDLLESQESLYHLKQAISNLREEEKEVFLLRQNGGLTYEQIAEIRNAPVGTVKTQMRTALQKLRRVLDPN